MAGKPAVGAPWKNELTDRPARIVIVALFILGAVLFLRPNLNSDGAFYYGWLRSLIFDGDLNLYNESVYYPHGWMSMNLGTLNPAGYLYNGFSCGPGMIWTPFVLAAHLFAEDFNASAIRDGYSPPYIYALAFAAVVCGCLAALLLYDVCRKFASPGASLGGVMGIFATSPLIGYVYSDTTFSHVYSMLGVTLLLAASLRARERGALVDWLMTGAALGVAMLMRWQDVLFAAIPAAFAIEQMIGIMRQRKFPSEPETNVTKAWWIPLRHMAAACLVALLMFTPQLLIWKVGSGSMRPPLGEGFLQWGRLFTFFNVLFDPLHGLFTWSPFLLIVFCFIPIFWRRDRLLAGTLFAVFYLQVYVNSVVVDWWAGGSFGMRRLCNVMPLFALALACAFQAVMAHRWRWRGLIVTTGLFAWWNAALAACWFGAAIDTLQKLDAQVLWLVLKTAVIPENAHVVLGRLPFYRGIVCALQYGDFRWLALTLAGLLALALLCAGAAAACSRLRRMLNGEPKSNDRTGLAICNAVITVSLFFNIWVLWTASGTARISIVEMFARADLHAVRRLTMNVRHSFPGGNVDLTLKPGEIYIARFDQPVTANRLSLTSDFTGDTVAGTPFAPAVRLTLMDDSEKAMVRELRFCEDTAPSELCVFMSDLPDDLPLNVVREWKYHRRGRAIQRTYGSVLDLDESRRWVSVQIEPLLPYGEFHLRGFAFAERGWDRQMKRRIITEEMRASAGELLRENPWSKQYIVDLYPGSNSDYHSNPFVPRAIGHRAEYPSLEPGPLDFNGIRFMILPDYNTSGKWPVLTTACGDGYKAALSAGGRRFQKLCFAWCGGVIRTHEPRHLATLTLVYSDKREQKSEIYANRDVYEYIYHTPLSRLIYDIHGTLGYWEVETDYRDVALDGILIEDANGHDDAGVSIFGITGVLSE